MRMRRAFWLAALGLAFASSVGAQERVVVTLGTATPGGGFPVYGDAVAEAINGLDPALEVRTRNTKGSTENVPMLERGELDLGLVQGEVAHEALSGVGRPPADLRILAAMYPTPGLFVVRADSPVRTIEDLRGKPVAFGARGSGLVVLARYVLDGLGLDQERDFQAVYLDRAGDGPAMVLDGRVAALWGGGIGWPGFVTVGRAPGGARYLAPDADGLAPHPGQARLPEADERAGRIVPRPDRGDPVGRLVELHHDAADTLRRHGLSPRPRAASRPGRAGRAAAAGGRHDGGEHGGLGAAARADSSRRAALPGRDRPAALTPRALRATTGASA